MFVDILFILACVILVLSLVEHYEAEKEPSVVWIYAAVSALLFAYVAFRPIGIDNDSYNYVAYVEESGQDTMLDMIEPSFLMLAALAKMLGDVRVLFVVYALLAIPLKVYSLTRLTNLWFLTLLIWVSHFFLIQDVTQIRVAVSTAIFLYALKFLMDGERWKYVGCIAVAVFFHYSALLLLPFVFLRSGKLSTVYRVVLLVLPMLFYVLYLRGIDILTYLPIPMFQDKIEVYESLRDHGVAGEDINVFNAYALIRLFTYYLLLWKYDVVAEKVQGLSLLLKIMCFSICVYASLAFLPALAIRGSEICGVVDILLIPYLVYTVRPYWAGKALVALFGVVLLVYNIFVSEYLKFDM